MSLVLNDATVHIQSDSLSEKVYRSLKMAIIKGELPSGYRLRVLDLTKKFEVSQAPVREALERLKQEGLIIGRTNKGSMVSEITHKEIRDIYALRVLIEGHAIRETMKRIPESALMQLHMCVERMRRAMQQRDPYLLIESDMEYHSFFYRNSDNAMLQDMWEKMMNKIMRFIAITNEDRWGAHIWEGHLEILEMLKAGKVEEAIARLTGILQFYKDYTGE